MSTKCNFFDEFVVNLDGVNLGYVTDYYECPKCGAIRKVNRSMSALSNSAIYPQHNVLLGTARTPKEGYYKRVQNQWVYQKD